MLLLSAALKSISHDDFSFNLQASKQDTELEYKTLNYDPFQVWTRGQMVLTFTLEADGLQFDPPEFPRLQTHFLFQLCAKQHMRRGSSYRHPRQERKVSPIIND